MFYDSNDIQLSTETKEVMNEDTAAKYRALGWYVIEINGNDAIQIRKAIEEAKAEVDEILRNASQNFILGADDSVPNDSDPEKLRALVDYVHSWRQTHK